MNFILLFPANVRLENECVAVECNLIKEKKNNKTVRFDERSSGRGSRYL